MPVLWKYVRRLKSGRLEFRRAFPKRVKHYLRRHELIVSLEGRCLTEAGAMERYRAANETYARLLLTASKAVSGKFDELDRPRMAWLIETYEANYLALDDAERVAGTADPERHDAADDGFTSVLEIGNVAQIRAMFEDDAVALAAEQGWVFDKNSQAFSVLCRELLGATIRVNRLRIERDRGNPVPTPIAPEPPQTKREGETRNKSRSFVTLVREEMERPTFSGGASTKQSWNTALRYLGEVLGDLPPEEITRRKVSDLADTLALAPIKRAVPQSQRDWPLPRLAEAYVGKDIERLSRKAITTILGALQAAWNKCQRSGRIADALANPFSRPNLGKAPARRRNDGFTREECAAILGLPIFTEGARPVRGRGEACFWLPPLLLTTGARPEELAQLLVGDVERGSDNDRWNLSISANGTHPYKGERKLKTPSAERVIPLPRALVELGLAEYIAWLEGRGESALFPALRPKGERGELFASFGDWWSGYLREKGVALPGKRPAREFRPTWTTIARECGVTREAQEYLMGHAPAAGDMNAIYGSREPLSREMRKLSFDGWGLEKVRAWEPPSQ